MKDEEFFRKNKRTIIAQRQTYKMKPTSFHGGEFSQFPSDDTHFYKKSLLPLDKKPLQEAAFRITGR